MNAVVRIDLERLAKICSLFSSDHGGERAAAAYKANQIVRAAGLRWPDVIGVASNLHPPRQAPATQMTPADILARHEMNLTEWEKGFLESLARRRRDLTTRQKQVLADIRDRIKGASR